MKIIIGFSYTDKILSRTIATLMDSKISHCYIRTKINDIDMVFQASGLLVNAESFDMFRSMHTVIEEYETEIDIDTATIMMLKELGKPYSVASMIGYLWVIFCKQFGFYVSNPWHDGNQAYVCSEFVCRIMGVNDDMENITPEELRVLCASTYKRIT